jgi:DNA-binding XRE family transcriptional regulator
MESQSQFSKNLKAARLRCSMTQAQVAKKADISVNYYARMERDEVNPSLEVFKKVVKALNAKSSDILDF